MATLTTATLNFQSSDNATYQAWLQHVKDVMDWVNPSILTQTADTGQVDIPSAVRPTTNTQPHYLVYKFDDGLGPPVYIKIFMGSSGTSAGMTSMRFWFGTSTDGAGNITGISSQTSVAPSGNSGLNGTGVSFASCGPGFLSATFGQSDSSSAWGLPMRGFFIINRFHDNAGSPTAEGFSYRAGGNYPVTSFPDAGVLIMPNAIYPAGARWQSANGTDPQDTLNPFALSTETFAGNVQVQPVFCRDPLIRQDIIGACLHTDIAKNTEVSIALLGTAPRNYKNLSMPATPLAAKGFDYLVLWE